ncbi:hypothetical protein ACFL3K_01610 [Pseudomonadota bacterium]
MSRVTKTALLATAKDMGLKGLSKMKKPEVIHAIQVAEGNSACFQKIPNCGIGECRYRRECI